MHRRPEPDIRVTADILFGPAKVAVFVDGCFWHRCPDHCVMPKGNAAWWDAKLQANRERDRHNDEMLRAHDWGVVRVWEHEDPQSAADRISGMIDSAR